MLGVSYVADINSMVGRGEITDFIRVNEALHEKTIADIAANIAGNPERRVVLIAGPSSSGKTTFASRLAGASARAWPKEAGRYRSTTTIKTARKCQETRTDGRISSASMRWMLIS